MMADQFPDSPLIQKLQRRLESGDDLAIDDFWREIQSQGAPLIEFIDNIEDQALVTFVWQADTDCTNVFIFGGPAQPDQMTRLADTNLWFRSYYIRRDARFSYELGSSNIPTGHEGQVWDPDLADWQLDPLNPKICSYAHDDEGSFIGYTASLLELSEAAPQPWGGTRDNVPAGKIRLFHYQSQLLQNERRIWIYTPPDLMMTNKTYDLVLLFDGFIYSQVIPTPIILDNLLAENLIRPAIVIMMNSPDRLNELSINPQFMNFLIEEFIPWIRTNYPVTDDPKRTILGGSSAGGFAALYLALKNPNIFGKVISQSGAFWLGNESNPNWFIEWVSALPKKSISLFLDVGIYEPQNLMVNQKLRDVLNAKDYDFRYIEWASAHEPLSWQGGVAEAFMTLLTNKK